MLDRLRDRAAQILAATQVCTLATTGPAGIQASMMQCAGRGITLYVLVPDTSDHLFNLESAAEVAVTAKTWHLLGLAAIMQESNGVFTADQRQWHTVIKVTPVRLHVQADHGAMAHAETIDFEPDESAPA